MSKIEKYSFVFGVLLGFWVGAFVGMSLIWGHGMSIKLAIICTTFGYIMGSVVTYLLCNPSTNIQGKK